MNFEESITKALSSSPTRLSPNIYDNETDVGQRLNESGINVGRILRNEERSILVENAIIYEGARLTSTGALSILSGAKTGRSPKDKRIVIEETTKEDVWWGSVNIGLDKNSFMINRERAVDYLNTCERLYVIDGYAGWDRNYRLKIRVICASAYHALFMENMLIMPNEEELRFFEPDFIIYNAGQFPANRYTKGMTSATSVSLSFEEKEMVILGTKYAGEMKKGVFTIMNYYMIKRGVLPLHSSCNIQSIGANNPTLFFGLSGTGKTTLSADPNRNLIGDDEHVWTESGIFNIEGGCYAKCINLSNENEPAIYNAIRFGAVVENVVLNEKTREIDFTNISITENTRCAYPLNYIENTQIPAITVHPSNIIMLTCDAFGVLPPVSKLTPEQAMYHFISGYTAKVAGTEVGITEPTPNFSACFGEPFLVWHPIVYAELLAKKIREHKLDVWLVNTGWSGGGYGEGKRMSISVTRSIIDAIHNGTLSQEEFYEESYFGLKIPTNISIERGINFISNNNDNDFPSYVLNPKNTWIDKDKYDLTAIRLSKMFEKNFEKYKDRASEEVLKAGPRKLYN
jgi:ATP-dependent phosphoenolpyruvate carboxykinase